MAVFLGAPEVFTFQAWIASGAWFAAGSIPIIALIVARRWLGPLGASSWLVVYGVLVLLFEHTGFTFVYTLGGAPQEGFIAPPHARVHAFMAAVYATIGMIAFAILVGRLLQTRSRLAWGTLFAAFIVGGSIEVVMNGPSGLLFQHTSPPNSIHGANLLWTYLFAWAAALLVARPAVFGEAVQTNP